MYTSNTQDGEILNVMVSFRFNTPPTPKKMVFLRLPNNVFTCGQGVSILLDEIVSKGHKLYRKGDKEHEVYVHNYVVDKIKKFNQYNYKLGISIDCNAYQQRTHHSLLRLGVSEHSITFA